MTPALQVRSNEFSLLKIVWSATWFLSNRSYLKLGKKIMRPNCGKQNHWFCLTIMRITHQCLFGIFFFFFLQKTQSYLRLFSIPKTKDTKGSVYSEIYDLKLESMNELMTMSKKMLRGLEKALKAQNRYWGINIFFVFLEIYKFLWSKAHD